MAYRQRTGVAAATQSVPADDPDFLRFIVERVVQEVLVFASHIGPVSGRLRDDSSLDSCPAMICNNDLH